MSVDLMYRGGNKFVRALLQAMEDENILAEWYTWNDYAKKIADDITPDKRLRDQRLTHKSHIDLESITENLWTVFWKYTLPARSRVVGNSGRFGESGKC